MARRATKGLTEAPLRENSDRAPAAVDDEDLPRFGPEIRGLRKQTGMTLAELAKASGLSVSFLSQVERDASTLSVTALFKVARALGVHITWFFHATDSGLNGENEFVVREKDRRHLQYKSGVFDELLLPHLRGPLGMFMMQFPSGAYSGDTKVAPGSDHAGLVLEGEFELTINGQSMLLKAGDSFGFSGANAHRYGNPGSGQTKVIWVLTPPSY